MLQFFELFLHVVQCQTLLLNVCLKFFVLVHESGQFYLHLRPDMIDLHTFDRLKFILLPLQLGPQLTPNASSVKVGHLVLLELSFQVIIELLDVIIESFSVSLHFLNHKL